MNDFSFFVQRGLFHVLDKNAYDHILFLIALVVIYQFKDWKKILAMITAFTIGHTLTLALSVFQIFRLKSEWIEFLIPLTIFVTGMVNILFIKRNLKSKGLSINVFFAFFFGLVHGMGFSGYFEMIVGKAENKLLPLIEFALGIELAQMIIVFIVLLFGIIIQNIFKVSKRDWILVISSIVAGMTIPMLIERVFW
ncbi:HupE/UreJ family protein [Namhaeicola litoreus]|uniref:HupE/UreJ family protein n=1 Tax=Namhaeicola litoreus TaxID=1052145 RepID=A0ABW3Y0R7_9FLAO